MVEVQKVLNSQEEVRFDESFSIIVSYATPPAGSALVNVPRPLQNRLSKSTSIFVIKNKDEICMARAIVVGIAKSNGDRAAYKKMQDSRKDLQKKTALLLIQNAGLPVRSYSIADIPAFEVASQTVKFFNSILYSRKKIINLILVFDFPGSFYCPYCFNQTV